MTEQVVAVDNYTEKVLRENYTAHKNYVLVRKEASIRLGIKIRFAGIPEDISENMIKFIIHKCGDKTSNWNCKFGDLMSNIEGKQECKCFTSDGPPSFSPTSDWDVIYFLDARKWLEDVFVLYKVKLKKSSNEWKNIKVTKTELFEDKCKQGVRPRINWESLYPQISPFCEKVFEGSFDSIFTVPTAEAVFQQ